LGIKAEGARVNLKGMTVSVKKEMSKDALAGSLRCRQKFIFHSADFAAS